MAPLVTAAPEDFLSGDRRGGVMSKHAVVIPSPYGAAVGTCGGLLELSRACTTTDGCALSDTWTCRRGGRQWNRAFSWID